MINTDYEELYTKLLIENFQKSDYQRVVDNLIENSGELDPLTEAEAVELLIESKVNISTEYLIDKIGEDAYDEIATLPVGRQLEQMKLYEVYFVMYEMLKLKTLQKDDGYSSQSDDYISLTKDIAGVKAINDYYRKLNAIIRKWYSCEIMN